MTETALLELLYDSAYQIGYDAGLQDASNRDAAHEPFDQEDDDD